MAVTDSKQAGAIVFWSLNGQTPLSALEMAASTLNLAVQPGSITWAAALRRAVGSLCKSKRDLARPLANHEGWALVCESVDPDHDLAHSVNLAARLKEAHAPGITEVVNYTVEITPEDHPRKQELLERMAFHLNHLDATDVSDWLVALMPSLNAVGLRPRGGMYFIPQPMVAAYHALAEAIHAHTVHSLYEVPALQTKDAVRAVLDAITREALAEAEAMELALDLGDSMKEGTRKRKAAHCEAVAAKVASYEELLGQALPELQERLKGLHRQLTISQLQGSGA